jgi:3'-phosphoadenosine 5'-phosphosulfate sulfotransferase (PAPS reductase)/FAD synthetase
MQQKGAVVMSTSKGAVVSEQLSVLPKQEPESVISGARELFSPIASFCLFSGGNDSTVLAHRCRDAYQALMHIDTGTAVPGVREFVESYAKWLGKPLLVYEAGDAFRDLVLEQGGFPGPAGHGRAYTRLKERQIEALVRDFKTGFPRTAKVMLLTGKRRAESARRAKTTAGVEARGGQLFVNPLIDWTTYDMRAYRREHNLPESNVAALLHRSGECNCGAFAEEGEREMLRALWPEWFVETIGALEQEAQAAGVPACRWGERPPSDEAVDAGPLCSSCEWRQLGIEDAA